MNVLAISDPHLSIASPKPMNIFGAHWEGYWERMQQAWRSTVSQDDLVLLPGDISWAMHLKDALCDLQAIGDLPGTKILLRGNHDYWWSSLSRVRAALPPQMYALQNDTVAFGAVEVCGTRGWTSPGSQGFSAEDERIYQRELRRLELSLNALKNTGALRIAMMHFPPFNERLEATGFTELLERYHVDIAVYGHLHDRSCMGAFEGSLRGVEYRLVSCDHLGFKPALLAQL